MKTKLIKDKIISAILFLMLINCILTKGQELSGKNNFVALNSSTSNLINENINSKKVAYNHYLLGVQKDNEGDYKTALEELSLAIKLNEFFSEAFDERGIVYTKLIMYKKALRDFNKAIELNLNFSEAYNHRGIVYYCLEEFGKAIADYNHALQLDPKYAKVYFNRGIVKLVLDDDKGAFDDIKKASDMNLKEAIDYLSKETL